MSIYPMIDVMDKEWMRLAPEALGEGSDAFFGELQQAWLDRDQSQMGKLVNDCICDYAQDVVRERRGE